VIATITRARNNREESLLLDALSSLGKIGVPVFVGDGGSRREFVERLSDIPGFEVARTAGGLVAQVKTALRFAVASGTPRVIYTEPDKRHFFEAGLPRFLERVQQHEDADIVIASRDQASFDTFPAGQRRTEQLFNELGAGFGLTGDLLYGPLALRSARIAQYIAEMPDDLGWGWRPYVMARCLIDGGIIASHEAFYPCPNGQRGEDDGAARLYRLEQLSQNVRGLHLGLKAGRS
jgi:hypothetical protein